MVTIFYADEFLNHETGPFHPECPARLTAIVNALQHFPWPKPLTWRSPTPINQREVLSWVEKLHSPHYIRRVKAIAESGGGGLDGDTPISAQSYEVALLAVSAWLDGVDRVLGDHDPAFVLARPPGHHAVRNTGMGFCLFSNAAIAAHYALTKPGIERVAILDWDVHHGNGTEALIEDNPQLFYCSLHEFPCYPGTGRIGDRGKYNNVLNIPMTGGSTIQEYRVAFQEQVIPFFQQINPDLLIISAGYDANQADPLADIALKPEDFGEFTRYLLPITPNLLFGLEGGYDLDALAASVIETIKPLIPTIPGVSAV